MPPKLCPTCALFPKDCMGIPSECCFNARGSICRPNYALPVPFTKDCMGIPSECRFNARGSICRPNYAYLCPFPRTAWVSPPSAVLMPSVSVPAPFGETPGPPPRSHSAFFFITRAYISPLPQPAPVGDDALGVPNPQTTNSVFRKP